MKTFLWLLLLATIMVDTGNVASRQEATEEDEEELAARV